MSRKTVVEQEDAAELKFLRDRVVGKIVTDAKYSSCPDGCGGYILHLEVDHVLAMEVHAPIAWLERLLQ